MGKSRDNGVVHTQGSIDLSKFEAERKQVRWNLLNRIHEIDNIQDEEILSAINEAQDAVDVITRLSKTTKAERLFSDAI